MATNRFTLSEDAPRGKRYRFTGWWEWDGSPIYQSEDGPLFVRDYRTDVGVFSPYTRPPRGLFGALARLTMRLV